MENITAELLIEAYLKLKSHIYHDNSELFLRSALAKFETEPLPMNNLEEMFSAFDELDTYDVGEIIKNKLNNLLININSANVEESEYFSNLFSKIDLIFLPKKFKQANITDSLFTNKRTNNNYDIDKVTIFADFPIELHLVCVLWVMIFGYKLDIKLDDSCKGNRLVISNLTGKIVQGSAYFKPYYRQYQSWRDKAIIEAKNKLGQNENIAFINLDLRDFYYSVEIDFKSIEEIVLDEFKNYNQVNSIFKIIHFIFTNRIKTFKYPYLNFDKKIGNKIVLPIGISSSYVLANWYLNEFDLNIRKFIPQVYYSRYVDDILLVVTNPDLTHFNTDSLESIKFSLSEYNLKEGLSIRIDKMKAIEKFILHTFYPLVKLVPALRCSFSVQNDNNYIFILSNIKGAIFQADKTIVHYFDHSESTSIIDKLKEELDERSSEFRDFPEDELDTRSFDDQAFHLIYDNTDGKIRTLKDYKENKYGLSVFLAHRIFTSLIKEDEHKNASLNYQEESEKIIKLFKGINCLDYFTLWEKIFTYFLINKDIENFTKFFINVCHEINKLDKDENIGKTNIPYNQVYLSLYNHLFSAFEMAISLNGSFIAPESKHYNRMMNSIINKKSENSNQIRNKYSTAVLYKGSKFRFSNLMRHRYINYPLINYTSLINKDIDFTSSNFQLFFIR